jgi:chemosensory pili system protein ChpA (sensor histidine kinase/response regulator)
VEFETDTDLKELFLTEVRERSARLAEGARALESGEVTADLAGDMLREGHTIKGTGRVMGYEGVSRAGLLLEQVWSAVQQGMDVPGVDVGRAMGLLVDILPDSLDEEGVAALAIAMRRVRDAVAPAGIPDLATPVMPAGLGSPRVDTVPVSDGATALVPNPAPKPPAVAPVEEVEVRLETVTPDPEDDIETGETPLPVAAPVDEPQASEPVTGPVPVAVVEAPPDSPATPMAQPLVFDDSGGPLVFEVEPAPSPPSVASAQEDSVPEAPEPLASVTEHDVVRLPSSGAMSPGDDGVDISAESPLHDLGGLIGALESWASEESVTVNTARLYQLVNDLAALRIDLEATQGTLEAAAAASSQTDPLAKEAIDGALGAVQSMYRTAVSLEQQALRLGSIELRSLANTLPQLVRYLGRKTDKQLTLEIVGDDIQVDRQVLDRLGDAIRQLIVNAVSHGIESVAEREAAGKASTASVGLHATTKESRLQIIVTDDGHGIDWEAVHRSAIRLGMLEADAEPTEDVLRGLLFEDGFSTLEESIEIAGDGSGLARVKHAVEELHGSLSMETAPGRGTSFSITVPAHRALQQALLVAAGDQLWGIPEAAVANVLPMSQAEIAVTEAGNQLETADGRIPIASFAEVVGLGIVGAPTYVVVLNSPIGPVALTVESLAGSREVAAKELGALLAGPEAITGAALLGGGEVVLLVDAGRLAERQRSMVSEPVDRIPKVLVVDDSKGVQQVVSGALASSGFATFVAGSVAEALSMLAEYEIDALVVDFSMPRADGVALVHMVRQRYGHMPVVMLSGVASEEDQARAESAGVDAFFDKADFREGGLAVRLRELIDEANGS